ncbi:MAG: hypothetical protein KDB14_10830 [Planctomycetales bacterium]|nr:hypothetical protein [Planctomycetales bacterium]
MSMDVTTQAASQVPPPSPEGIWSKLKEAVAWLATSPRRMSTPAKAAWVLFFVLLLLVVVAWTLFWMDKNNGPWRHLISTQWVAGVAVLAVAIPYVAYRGLRLWLEGDASPFPEIDYAWQAGVDALRENGIELGATPIYLLLGSSGTEQEAALVSASGRGFRVAGVPEGPAPLHWYANPDAIYLFATEASWISALAALKERRATPTRPGAHLPELYQAYVASSSDAPLVAADESLEEESVAASAEPDSPRGTIMLDQFMAKEAAKSGGRASAALRAAEAESTQTQSQTRLTMAGEFTVPVGDQGPAVISPQEAGQRSQQLEYLCQLLIHAREPVCPINGLVTLLPFALVKGPPTEIEQLQSAVRSDVSVAQKILGLRCPVTCLVAGLEMERGFRELVRRVGREMASAQRFGQKFDVCQSATSDQMSALSAHVCGAFEDWVYTLFREEDALTRAGNTRLYGLLCKVRCMLKTRLTQILIGGFGHDPERHRTSIAFSGCYFAATGATPDRQAFVRGIFDKLHEEQEMIEWSRDTLVGSERFRRASRLGVALSVALALSAAVMIYFRVAG